MGEGEKTDTPAASGDLEYGDRAPSSLRSRRSSAWQPLAGGLSGLQRRGSEAVHTITEVGHESVVELNHNVVPVQTVPVGKKTSTEDFISPTTDRLNSLSIGPEFSSIEMLRSAGWIHEDGIKRSGNTWTASGHIITAVIGAGVLALPYAMASLGWILGSICFVFFAWVTLFTAQLLADLYIIDGVRQRTFPQMVRTVMGVPGMIALGIIQQANLVLTALAYTITAAQSMKDMADLSCAGESGCFNHQWAMGVMFGGVQLFLSQVPTLESFWLASIIGAIMSFGYSFIALGLTIAYHGTKGGIKPMTEGLTSAQQAWNILNSIGTIEFAYSFSIILLEIQDTLSNAEGKATGPITKMKRAVNISVAVMTGFYISIACAGFASLGYNMQGYILTDYIGIAPNWVLYMANAMVIAHLVAAYQVWSQPHFALVEDWMENKVCKDVKNPTLRWMTRGFGLRLLYRSFYVVIVTFLAVLLPFFQSVLGFVGALGFWPMTVFFPVNCWIRVFRPGKAYRIFLRILDVVCFVITVAVIVASVESMIQAAKSATLFA